MTLEPTIHCIGSVAEVSLWTLQSPRAISAPTVGVWGGTVQGNDAVLVARILADRGLLVSCQLLQPTSSDAQRVSAALGFAQVMSVGQAGTDPTRALCIEQPSGKRDWIFSRLPRAPSASLYAATGTALYVDHYPEFGEYFVKELPRLAAGFEVVYVNVSSISEIVPTLPLAAAVAQASAPDSLDLDGARALAIRVLEVTGAVRAVVTLGRRGAVLAMANSVWYQPTTHPREGGQLGAGAIFSSAMIGGLLKGLDREPLLESAMAITGASLADVDLQERCGFRQGQSA